MYLITQLSYTDLIEINWKFVFNLNVFWRSCTWWLPLSNKLCNSVRLLSQSIFIDGSLLFWNPVFRQCTLDSCMINVSVMHLNMIIDFKTASSYIDCCALFSLSMAGFLVWTVLWRKWWLRPAFMNGTNTHPFIPLTSGIDVGQIYTIN